jgi:murein DD-endopeptidase MepM/ murein hydrolase activator NlpD
MRAAKTAVHSAHIHLAVFTSQKTGLVWEHDVSARRIALCMSAAFAAAGCQTYPIAYVPPPAPTTPAAAPSGAFAYAPTAPLHSELFVCHAGGSNLGPVGSRGEAALYTPYLYSPAGPLLRNPTESACLSSGFGWRARADGGGRNHSGLDLANRNGGYVFAAGDARVDYVGEYGAYGLMVELDHGHGVRTLYAHLAEIDPSLQRGDIVYAGRVIARMGRTGNATGIHLHYEVSIDGQSVDPLAYGAEAPIS